MNAQQRLENLTQQFGSLQNENINLNKRLQQVQDEKKAFDRKSVDEIKSLKKNHQ